MELAHPTIDSLERIRPTKGARAFCPCCRQPVKAKCGNIKVHHWAHESLVDCDSWSEGEGPWHKEFKTAFTEARQEVVVGKHRADVKTSDGWVIELQSSSISVEEIEERERYYGNMVWILDGTTKRIVRQGVDRFAPAKVNFRIYHPRPSWLAMKKEKFIDIGGFEFLHVTKISEWNGRQYATGDVISVIDFMNRHVPYEDISDLWKQALPNLLKGCKL